MKITAQEEYGLRCLMRLADSYRRGAPGVTVREIAEQEGLSSAYVEKLLRCLSRSGLAQSVRGVHGGYHLTRTPEDIMLGQVLKALGGIPQGEHICNRFIGDRAACVHMTDCGIRSVWSSMTDYLHRLLDATPLSTLLHNEADVQQTLAKQLP